MKTRARMRSLTAVVLVVTAGILAACGSSSKSSTPGSTSPGGSTSGSSGTSGSGGGKVPAGTKSHPSFVYLQTDGSQSYFVLEGDGAQSEASQVGATVKVENESNSSATTIDDIQTAIADKVSGIIVVAPDSTLGPRMTGLAKSAGIPIMASDNGFADSSGQQVPFVGIDAAAFGASTGSILMSNYHSLGWSSGDTYMLLYTNPALPTCNMRTDAEESTVVAGGFPKSHILTVPTTDNTTEAAFTNTGPVKTSHPQASHWLLAGCNDDVAFGGAKALVSSGLSASDVDAVGLGGDLACQVWGSGAPNVGFRGTNYIFPNGIGGDAVKEMYGYVVHHTPFPANTYVSPIPMTHADFKTVDKAC